MYSAAKQTLLLLLYCKIRCGRNYANRKYVLFAYGLSFLFIFKTNTHFCRETMRNVENTRFLVSLRFKTNTHFCCETLRNVENTRFLVSFLTQILLRHLVKKMESEASEWDVSKCFFIIINIHEKILKDKKYQ